MILRNRVAIVTGAGSGIGEAGAAIMAREGAHVVVVDKDAARAEAATCRIREAGGAAEALVLDVTDDRALEAGIASVASRHGRIDILHNHAGSQVAGSFEQVRWRVSTARGASMSGRTSWPRASSCR